MTGKAVYDSDKADNQFDAGWKHEMKVSGRRYRRVSQLIGRSVSGRSTRYLDKARANKHSEGLADLDYCAKMEKEVPVSVQYLIDRWLALLMMTSGMLTDLRRCEVQSSRRRERLAGI